MVDNEILVNIHKDDAECILVARIDKHYFVLFHTTWRGSCDRSFSIVLPFLCSAEKNTEQRSEKHPLFTKNDMQNTISNVVRTQGYHSA